MHIYIYIYTYMHIYRYYFDRSAPPLHLTWSVGFAPCGFMDCILGGKITD